MEIGFASPPWWLIWLALCIVFIIIEICTSMVFGLCMAPGYLGGFFAALAGMSVTGQILVIVVVSLVAFIAVNPLMSRLKLKRKLRDEPSNMYALIGRRGKVDAATQRLKIDGDNWQVRPADNKPLPPDATVEVVGYDSIVLIVKQVSQ